MANHIYCELLKLKRSKIVLITVLGAVVTPVFIFILHLTIQYRQPDAVFVMADFYDGALLFTMLMLGPIVYVVIATYLFSREYTENTLKTILSVPVKKFTFITGKFLMLFFYIIFLTGITWLVMSIFTIIFHGFFGFEEFGVRLAARFLGQMMIGGTLMFLTITPFAFLAIWTKGFVVPLITAATVVLGNMMVVNSELGELFPWVSSFLLVADGVKQFVYPFSLVVGLIAVVSILGFVLSVIYFQRKDI